MARKSRATLLAKSIRLERWDVAALCLLLGLAQALSKMPPDTIEGVLDVLDSEHDKES